MKNQKTVKTTEAVATVFGEATPNTRARFIRAAGKAGVNPVKEGRRGVSAMWSATDVNKVRKAVAS